MRGLMVLVFATALFGCTDTDGDGVRDKKDCAPADPSIFPGQKEVCNGHDDDCNGQVDEDVALVAYWDRDLDGYGDTNFVRRVCKMPDDGAEVGGDCDDQDPTVHPDALELCDLQDNDCDGAIDNDVVSVPFYADTDGDGFGDPGNSVQDCVAPDGYVGNADDCDDSEPRAWTDAEELCDGLDNDCNGSIDEGLPLVRVWTDADGDGAGDPNSPTLACGPTAGFSADDRDCDDTNPALGGGSLEVQGNGVDEDCDGYIDEYGVPAPYATYQDALAAIGAGSGTEVVQFDDGWHQVTIHALDANVIFAGEGCDRTILYGATQEPVATLNSGGIEGLTLTGGTGIRGGGLRVEGGEVWAIGVCIEDNTSSNRGGGAAVVDDGILHLHDSLVRWNRTEQVGGGVYGHANTTLDIQRTIIVENDVAISWGGGVGVRGGHVSLLNSVVAGNTAAESAGGLYVANEYAPPPGDPYGPDGVRDGSADVYYTTFHGNSVGGLPPTSQGAAVLLGGTIGQFHHVTFSGHPAGVETITTKSANVMPAPSLPSANRFAAMFSSDLHFRGNQPYDFNGSWFLEVGRGAHPDFANVDPALPASDWDLRYLESSDWRALDVGAWAGPDAMWDQAGVTPLWRPWPHPDSAFTDDTDGDGLFDAFETRHGLSELADESSDDPDADGLSTLAEQAAATDPWLGDTDGDGQTDGDELSGGTDPKNPADHRPLADAGPDRFALVGQATTLLGDRSLDPNNDALSWSWAVVSAPFGSVAAFANPTSANASITPDQPGVYEIELTVSDGAGEHRVRRRLDALTGVIVPDQAATIAEAVALTYDGQGVFLRAGTWAAADLTGRSVALVGLAAADTVVIDGAGQSSAVIADRSGVVLAQLTLSGGSADVGGGLLADGAGQITLRDVRIIGNVAGLGGGIYAEGTDVDARWMEIRDNFASEGGGIYALNGDLDLTGRVAGNTAWHGGGLWVDLGEARLDNTEIQSNVALEGSGAWIGDDGRMLMNNCATAGNPGESVIYNQSGVLYALGTVFVENQPINRQVTLFGTIPNLFRVMRSFNGGDPTFWYNVNIAAAAEPLPAGDPLLVSWIDDGNPDNDWLIPRLGSPLVDLGWPEWTDPDGSDSDVGLSAGPLASVSGARGQWDSDADGLDDAWETLFGLDPFDAADASSDVDADGLDALAEYGAHTNPNASDSDGDGIDDPTEIGNGTDPAASDVERPFALASAGPFGAPGDPHALNGSASYDGNPGPSPLSFQWRVLLAPAGSSVTTADIDDPTAAVTAFTPDIGGRYLFGLVVNDGASSSHEALLEVRPRRYLEVPSAYATVADAYAVAEPGVDVVHLEPGIHDLSLVDWIPGVPIQGYGPDFTFVHGLPGFPAFDIDNAEIAEISELTIAGSNGSYGGGIECGYGEVTLKQVRFEFNASWEGGAMRANNCAVVFVDVDVLDNDVSSRGGGYNAIGGSLDWTRGEVARNSSDAVGGAIYLENVDATIRNVVIHHNQTLSGGAAVNQVILTPDPKLLTLDHVTVAGNDGRDGALYLALANVTNSVIQQNANNGLYESTSQPEAVIAVEYSAIWGNQIGDYVGDDITATLGVISADARFLRFDPYDGGGWDADFRLHLASALVDAGSPTAPLDPDGSRTDMGAWGGPSTWTDWDVALVDSDGDGMSDVFENAHGLDPLDGADAGLDPDADGLTNLEEHGWATNPFATDSDGDGWDDNVEVSLGDDPANGVDHAPVANPGGDINGATIGVPRPLSGLLSNDPDGDAITAWLWTMVGSPGRSSLTSADINNATGSLMSFTPDSPGTFVLSLTVTAGGVASLPETVRVSVAGTVLVPEDYATVPDAIEAVADGHTIDIAAGTWPTVADLEGKDMTLIGAGRDQTILDGEGRGTVLFGDNGEQLALQDLTVTGGMASEGGGIHIESSLGEVTLVDVDVVGNSSIYGGGVYIRNGTLTATGSRIADNDSGRNGGGIYSTGSNVDLFQTVVSGNISTVLHGAGINHYNNSLTIANCVVADNHTLASGGGIYVNGIDDGGIPYPAATTGVWIDQTHFVGNSAALEGGAISFVKANISLHNSVFAHHRGGIGAIVAQGTTNNFLSEYSLAGDNDVASFDLTDNLLLFPWPSDGDANGNLIGRPIDLVDYSEDGNWQNDDYALSPTSAGINAGDPAVFDADASRSDIGAFGGPDGDWVP